MIEIVETITEKKELNRAVFEMKVFSCTKIGQIYLSKNQFPKNFWEKKSAI